VRAGDDPTSVAVHKAVVARGRAAGAWSMRSNVVKTYVRASGSRGGSARWLLEPRFAVACRLAKTQFIFKSHIERTQSMTARRATLFRFCSTSILDYP
jgi:hypothetical protein